MSPVKIKPASSPTQFAPLSIARMLWKRKLMIIFCTVALSATLAAVIYSLPNIYRADVVILVDSQKIPEKFVASTVQVSLQDSLVAIRQQVLRAGRLQKIIQDVDLYAQERKTKPADEIIERMRKELTITLEPGWAGGRPGAFRVAYENRSPKLATAVVNTVAGLFIGENQKTRGLRAEGTSGFIENQLRQAKESLDEQERNLSRYKLQWTGELPQQEGALLSTLHRLQSDLDNHRDAINRAQQNKLMLDNTLRIAESTLGTLTRAMQPANSRPASVQSVQVVTAEAQRGPVKASEAATARLEAALARYNDEHPEVKRLKAEVARLRAEDAKAEQKEAEVPKHQPKTNLGPVAVTPTLASLQLIADLNRESERIATVKAQIELANREITTRTADREKLLGVISNYQAHLDKLPLREQEMAALTRDYETSKHNYQSLLDKKISADMASDMEREQQSERFTLVDPARIPTKPIRPRREIFYPAALLVSIGLSIGLALLLELKNNVVLGEWELPADVRVLGRVSIMDLRPNVTAAGGGRIWVAATLGTLLLGTAAFLISRFYPRSLQ